MTNYARTAIAVGFSLGLIFGVPLTASTAAEPSGSSDTQHKRQKKPSDAGGKQNSKTHSPATNCGAQNNGNCAPRYAKTGVCNGCKIKLPCPTRNVQPVRKAATPRQAQTPPKKLPKDWPNPENCRYALPSDPNWEAEKAACNQAGMPMQFGKSAAPDPDATPKRDDTIGGGIRSLLQPAADALRQKVDDGINQAHGAKPACPSNTSVEQDVGAGCHE